MGKDASGRIMVAFPYNPAYVEKVKTVAGHRWHPGEKYWSLPATDEIIKKILRVFKGEDIRIDPALYISARVAPALQSDFSILSPTLEKGGKGGFEDLRRELVSRKYSHKTVSRSLQAGRNKDKIE